MSRARVEMGILAVGYGGQMYVVDKVVVADLRWATSDDDRGR